MKEGWPDVAHQLATGILWPMIPLAVSGRVVVGVAVVGALVLVWVLLRMDARDQAAEKPEDEADRDD
jgi:hypothetical protein